MAIKSWLFRHPICDAHPRRRQHGGVKTGRQFRYRSQAPISQRHHDGMLMVKSKAKNDVVPVRRQLERLNIRRGELSRRSLLQNIRYGPDCSPQWRHASKDKAADRQRYKSREEHTWRPLILACATSTIRPTADEGSVVPRDGMKIPERSDCSLSWPITSDPEPLVRRKVLFRFVVQVRAGAGDNTT